MEQIICLRRLRATHSIPLPMLLLKLLFTHPIKSASLHESHIRLPNESRQTRSESQTMTFPFTREQPSPFVPPYSLPQQQPSPEHLQQQTSSLKPSKPGSYSAAGLPHVGTDNSRSSMDDSDTAPQSHGYKCSWAEYNARRICRGSKELFGWEPRGVYRDSRGCGSWGRIYTFRFLCVSRPRLQGLGGPTRTT